MQVRKESKEMQVRNGSKKCKLGKKVKKYNLGKKIKKCNDQLSNKVFRLIYLIFDTLLNVTIVSIIE